MGVPDGDRMVLPLHGFVLAGGKSTRMGRDKAMLPFRGEPMAARAVRTLAAVCERVSIVGSRCDLEVYASVVQDDRAGVGPLAGIEAGLRACRRDWVLFLPVDVPLLGFELLSAWCTAVLEQPGTRASYVRCGTEHHPAICMLHRDCATAVTERIEAGDCRLQSAFESLPGLWVADAALFVGEAECRRSLTNLNTPRELELTEQSGPI